MAKVLLIDVDGTLIDSYPGIRESFLAALDDAGIPVPDESFLRRIPGPPMSENFEELGMDERQVQRAVSVYVASQRGGAWAECTPFPGWAELLGRWREEGFILATATSKAQSSAERVLGYFGLLEYFDVIGAAEEPDAPREPGDNRPRRQGKRDVIAHTLDLLTEVPHAPLVPGSDGPVVDVTQVLMIGDRKHDVEGAAAFGIRPVMVGWGYAEDAERAAAPCVVQDAAELGRVVAEFAGAPRG